MDQQVALAEKGAGKVPEHYVWSFPGSIMVELSLDVVARLETQLKDAPQGLLIGSIAGSVSKILDVHPVTQAELAGMRRNSSVPTALTKAASPMGYFRVQHEGDLRLTAEDLALMAALFPHPNQVFLLIEYSESDTANASFFFWDSGRMFGDFAFLEFPFQASLLAAQEAERRRKAAVEIATEKSAPTVIPPPPPPAPLKRNRRKVLWAMAALLLMAGGGAYYVERFTPGGLRFPQWERLLGRAATGTHSPAVPAVTVSLGLQVERQQRGDLRLSWDRTARPVVEATGGSFIIQDGPTARVIPLDAGLVHAGSLLYTPSTDQVQMRLTVDRNGQSPVTEMVLVVVPATGAPQLHALAPKNAAPSLTEGLSLEDPPASSPPSPRVQRDLKLFTAPAAAATTPPSPVLGLPPAVEAKLPSDPLPLAAAPILAPPQPAGPWPNAAEPQPRPAFEYVAPQAVSRKAPIVPVWFRGPSNRAEQVQVTLTIDETGKVVKASPTSGGRFPGLVAAAVAAARDWTFKPARLRGQAVRSELVLNFNFQPRP